MALAVRARTEKLKQDLKPALDEIARLGEVMKGAGVEAKEVERYMARLRSEAVRGTGAFAQQDQAAGAFEDKLKRVKTATSAVAGAMSAMSSEIGGAVGHATRLGTSLMQSFLAGGSIAAGVTAIAAGFAAITGAAREAAAEIERVRKKTEDLQAQSRRTLESMQDTLARKQDELAVSRKLMDSEEAAERQVRREWQARVRATEAGIAETKAKLQRWYEEVAAEEEKMHKLRAGGVGANEGEIQKRRGWIAENEAHLKALQDELAAAKKIAALDLEAINHKRTKAAEAKKAADEAKAEADALAKMAAEGEEAIKRRVEDLGAVEAKREEAAASAEQADREAIARQRELRDAMAEAYGLQARMIGENARLEEQVLRDKMAAAGEAAMKAREAELVKQVEAAAETKVAEQAKEATEATRQRAAISAGTTNELIRQKQLLAEQADITKRFANFGGSSPFGFGKGVIGSGLGSIGMGPQRMRARVMPPAGGGSGAGGGGGGLNLPDLAPDIKALQAELAKIPPWFEKLASAVRSASAAGKGAVLDLGKAAERTATALRRDTDELRAEVRALAKAIERAGNGSGGGD
jgi:hypothetical protein